MFVARPTFTTSQASMSRFAGKPFSIIRKLIPCAEYDPATVEPMYRIFIEGQKLDVFRSEIFSNNVPDSRKPNPWLFHRPFPRSPA